jgi:DNA invertase Pin-like site-specific DNA recombinase
MRMTAIYARVSSEQQREENTIASQTASLIEFANSHDLEVPKELRMGLRPTHRDENRFEPVAFTIE